MEGAVEKINGHQLLLSGPLVDKYLEKMGQLMYERLKKHLTGLVPAIKLFIPFEIFDNMYKMFCAYGCTTHTIYNKKGYISKGKKVT